MASVPLAALVLMGVGSPAALFAVLGCGLLLRTLADAKEKPASQVPGRGRDGALRDRGAVRS